MKNYQEFLATKATLATYSGFDVGRAMLNNNLFGWQKDIVAWALKKGKCAIFADCGLGKTIMQLEWAHHVCSHTGGNVLIVAPLAVATQTQREGAKFGISVNICRSGVNIKGGINITNYEMLKHFDMGAFAGVVLDESSIIKHVGSQIRQELIAMFGATPYRLCCTATPAPNDYMELGNHSEFLGVMTRSEMLSTYFVHDGSDTSQWRLKGHAEYKFWAWVASWAAAVQNPRDLGYDGEGYDLPELIIKEHTVESELLEGENGQMLLFPSISKTLSERRIARKSSIDDRVRVAAEIANAAPGQVLVWCDLNKESEMLTKSINGAVEVAGYHDKDHKTTTMNNFSAGGVRVLVSKPAIAGWGMNWQNCNTMIFVGLSDSFEAYYQAIRRCWRYGQNGPVTVHIVTAESEGAVRENIIRKQRNAERMVAVLVEHTKNILYDEIHGTRKISESYTANSIMVLPTFIERMVS